jgi:UDP-2-acetamido-3-amino-2,3-dideoxy-glucuronate N-acetyltransferase
MISMAKNYKVWQPSNIYPTAEIGEGTNIGTFVEIGDKVKIGKNCKIGCGAFIPGGVTIGDEVFIAPNVVFCNDLHPKAIGTWSLTPTLVEDGVSIGANSTVIPGITIGKKSRIGAGSVVVCNIPEGETWVGNPAIKINRICEP